MNAYCTSQFGYCPLVWMNNSRTLNTWIIIQPLLIRFFRILRSKYHRNQETVAYEIFKVKNNMAPEILTETFRQNKIKYNLTNTKALLGRRIKTVMYGSETKLCLGSTIWNILLTELKDIVFPKLFKMKIREWAPKIVHASYIKFTYKTLDFCKLSTRTFLFCYMRYVIHKKESVEAVIYRKPHTP